MAHRAAPAIRAATVADADAVATIYNHYVLGTVVTFEVEAVPGSIMAERMAAVLGAGLPWLVAEEDGRVAGYAYASAWNQRGAYRHTVESTVYVAPTATGRGLGTRLYDELFGSLRQLGVHTVVAGVALANPASVALHEHVGMTRVALFREVGHKFGSWVDVGFWQVIL